MFELNLQQTTTKMSKTNKINKIMTQTQFTEILFATLNEEKVVDCLREDIEAPLTL